MKKLLVYLVFIFLSSNCLSQTYISLAPSLTASAGTIAEKSNLALEIGQQWDVFSLGIDLGKTTLAPVNGKDTSLYVELRPNLNIFQQGKFTNTITPGIGYVFNARENLLIEFSTGIEFSYSDRIHFNGFFGQYFYSGKVSASNVNFFGISAVYYFSPNNSSSIIKKQSK